MRASLSRTILIAVSLLAGRAAGQSLLKDINPALSRVNGASSPAEIVAVGPRAFLRANHRLFGRELWVSDGSPSGTRLVKDIHPAAGSSSPTNLTEFGGSLYFTAVDPGGYGLWKTDGTEPGSARLLHGSISTTSTVELARVGGLLMFSWADPKTGWELWKTDGTAAGTSMVVDVYAGSVRYEAHTSVIGNRAWFAAPTVANGYELWRTDGTTAGTALVHEFRPGPAGGANGTVATLGGDLFAVGDDGRSGFELWRLDLDH